MLLHQRRPASGIWIQDLSYSASQDVFGLKIDGNFVAKSQGTDLLRYRSQVYWLCTDDVLLYTV